MLPFLSFPENWATGREAMIRNLMWFTMGICAALVVYYVLYRFSLPLKPFIYQAF